MGVRACVCVCGRACVCVWVCVCMHASMCNYMRQLATYVPIAWGLKGEKREGGRKMRKGGEEKEESRLQ